MGLTWLAGMILPGYGALARGSRIVFPGSNPEKSPVRCAGVGTITEVAIGVRRVNVPWYAKKKNVRSLPRYNLGIDAGPPHVPPNWLRFNPSVNFAPFTMGAKKLAAFSALLRTYSNN